MRWTTQYCIVTGGRLLRVRSMLMSTQIVMDRVLLVGITGRRTGGMAQLRYNWVGQYLARRSSLARSCPPADSSPAEHPSAGSSAESSPAALNSLHVHTCAVMDRDVEGGVQFGGRRRRRACTACGGLRPQAALQPAACRGGATRCSGQHSHMPAARLQLTRAGVAER
jgi:hypothetical protein